MQLDGKQSVSAAFVGRREEEYGPFKGRDGETVHGYRKFVYLADENLNVSELRVRDDGLFESTKSLKLGQQVAATFELRARENRIEPQLVALKNGA